MIRILTMRVHAGRRSTDDDYHCDNHLCWCYHRTERPATDTSAQPDDQDYGQQDLGLGCPGFGSSTMCDP